MSNGSLTNPTPQFGTAEYPGGSGPDRCKSCNQSIGSTYYRVNGVLSCAYCGEQAKLRGPKDSHQVFVRGLLFGIGGAILGLVLYSAFGIITGLMVGYISLAVGYIVGKAMMKGSNGVGGRRYQIAAVLLTYAAVSIAAVPISISQYAKQQKAQKQNLVKHDPLAGATSAAGDQAAQPEAANSSNDSTPTTDASSPARVVQDPPMPASKPKMNVGAALGMLALVGLASPFLELQDPLHGIIGLVILFVGIRIAWKLTAGTPMSILGPFNKSESAKPDSGS
jgi:predicted lipid-binding transport protein (Tim44 family)